MLDRKLMQNRGAAHAARSVYASVAAAAALLLMVGRLLGPGAATNPVAAAPAQGAGRAAGHRRDRHTFDAALRSDDRPIVAGARLQAGVAYSIEAWRN